MDIYIWIYRDFDSVVSVNRFFDHLDIHFKSIHSSAMHIAHPQIYLFSVNRVASTVLWVTWELSDFMSDNWRGFREEE